MDKRSFHLILGSLLHDVGKVLWRSGRCNDPDQGGYTWAKEEIGLPEDVLRQFRFHRRADLAAEDLPADDLSFITYIADEISTRFDRKAKNDGAMNNPHRPLGSIFNRIHGNKARCSYPGVILEEMHEIITPDDKEKKLDSSFYDDIERALRAKLKEMEYTRAYLNSLIELLEALWSFIPSGTSGDLPGDISLYDHAKMTAGIATCLFKGEEKHFKEVALNPSQGFAAEDHFLYVHLDISGIQSFIYDISSEKALKNLRGRSFYLEILLQFVVDELLERLDYSRANLLYLGGGNAFLLCANDQKTKETIQSVIHEVNQWLLKHFSTSLYLAFGWAECSADDLSDTPAGRYEGVFRLLGERMSRSKRHRYSSEDLKTLNTQEVGDGTRECRLCLRDDLLEGDICRICNETIALSEGLLRNEFLVVTREEKGLILPFGYRLSSADEEKLRKLLTEHKVYRLYPMNKRYPGSNLATKIWVADYFSSTEFSQLAESSTGIPRLGVLKADVDDLGKAFTQGFKANASESISRTATLSRMLNLFFKYSVNDLLETPHCQLSDKGREKREATVVYSGGDDMFIVGSWDDIIGFAFDLEEAFRQFTQGTMHLSAGLGMFRSTFPISAMAEEVNRLEAKAKNVDGKNALALFSDRYVFKWETFRNNIIEGKLRFLQHHFGDDDGDRRFLYFILRVIRENQRLNLARLAYHMGRREERIGKDQTKVNQQILQWVKDGRDAHELEISILLNEYLTRERKHV